MDERAVSVLGSTDSPPTSLLVIPGCDVASRRSSEDWYPVYFGVSCAFFALRLLSGRGSSEEDEGRLTEVCDKVLRGSAQLLGVLVWKSQKIGFDEEKREIRQKLEAAERGLEELRRVRREDAKANEKVVGIFAAQEQRWFGERRKLLQRVGSLVNDVRVLTKKKDEVVLELTGKINELEVSVWSKESSLEEEGVKVAGLEEKLREANFAAEDLRERSRREAQEHSSKIWKHKTAFIELVSNQRRIEAELDRALGQVEATRREFESVLAQKEESATMVRKLSSELVKLQKDAEQKDKVLSAMLRKSRLDADEKQAMMLMMTKEAKPSKSKVGSNPRSRSRHIMNSQSQPHDEQDSTEEIDGYSAMYDQVQLEAEKYAKAIEQRHHLEVDAFVKQMRLKDEKLEEFRWRLLSTEIESKRLNSHVEALTEEISRLRVENTKLEAELICRGEELERLHSRSNQPSTHRQEVEEAKEEAEFRAVQSPERESEEEKEVDGRSITTIEQKETLENVREDERLPSTSKSSKYPQWKMDLQALGVFYKIKRLKQQLLMLERLIGKQESGHDADGSNEQMLCAKNFLSLISVLNKQVGRYQSLHDRTDDLCKRKLDKDLAMTGTRRTKELEVFLEETFQLQRYMVATGQKMMEIQSKVANGFVIGAAEQVEKSVGIDMKRFCDSLRSLFRDVQGGLEVRIAGIIGDIEGTLARDGMSHLR